MRSPTDRAPVRVLVKGAAPTTGPGYSGAIERDLLASGRNVVVRDLTRPAERVTTGIRSWEAQVFPWSPDVVVLDYARPEAERPPARGSGERRAARFADDLERLVQRIVYISNPLVLLPDAPARGAWAPRVNAALAEVVTRMDRDNVRVFATGPDPEDPDATGAAMAAVIGPWCDEHVPV